MGGTQDATVKCNLLLIGKTGTGKSSFANYLFGVDKFTTGTGAPVTKWEENFQQYSFAYPKNSGKSSVQINVYDSVGLESNNYDKWMGELKQFLSEKQVISGSKVLPANEIIHVCFYVINGAGARIESNELEIINTICKTHKIPVSVIITNCDAASESQISKLEKIINEKGIESIRVCSISRNTRGSGKTESFGKDNALKKVLEASYEKVGKELSIISFQQLINLVIGLREKFIKKIDVSDVSIFNLNEMDSVFEKISTELDEILSSLDDIKKILPSTYYNYYAFIEGFSIDFQGKNIFEEAFNEINDFEFDIENTDLFKKINKTMENIEEGNFFEKAGAVINVAGFALSIKKNIKEVITETFGVMIIKLNSQLRKIRDS